MKKVKEIDLLIFVDESYANKNGTKLLLCALVIEKNYFERLATRIQNKYPDLPEMHFTNLDKINATNFSIFRNILNLIIEDKSEKIFVLFDLIDLNLLSNKFGVGSLRDKNIQKRFTRLVITAAINKYIRRYSKVTVSQIIVDKGGKSDDKFFKEHAIKKIIPKTKAYLPEEIRFLDSKTKNNIPSNQKYAIFIQICDMLLGIFRNNVLPMGERSNTKNKRKMAEIFSYFIVSCFNNKNKMGKIKFHPKNCKTTKYLQSYISGKAPNIKHKLEYNDKKELKEKFRPKTNYDLNKWT